MLLGDVVSAAWGITEPGVADVRLPFLENAVVASIFHPRWYRAMRKDHKALVHGVKIVGDALCQAGVLDSCDKLWRHFRRSFDEPLPSAIEVIFCRTPVSVRNLLTLRCLQCVGESLDSDDFDVSECLHGVPHRVYIVHDCGARIGA